jgi:hypothetical protein
VKPVDYQYRGTDRRHQAEPRGYIKAGEAGLRHGREIGCCRRPCQRRNGERPQLALPHQGQRHCSASERHGDAPCQKVWHRCRYAAVWNVSDIDESHGLEQFAGEVLSIPDSAGGKCEFARLRASKQDEFLNVLRRQVDMCNQEVRLGAQSGNRGEVLNRIERQLLVEDGIGDDRPRVSWEWR